MIEDWKSELLASWRLPINQMFASLCLNLGMPVNLLPYSIASHANISIRKAQLMKEKERCRWNSLLCIIKVHDYSFIPTTVNMRTIWIFVIISTILCSKHEPSTILTFFSLSMYPYLHFLSLYKRNKVLNFSAVYQNRKTSWNIALEFNYVLNML